MNLWPGCSILIICVVVALGLHGPSVDASSSPGVNSKRTTFSFKQPYIYAKCIDLTPASTHPVVIYMPVDKINSWVLSLSTHILGNQYLIH